MRWVPLAILVPALVVLAGCAGGPPSTVLVEIKDFRFKPAELRIGPNTTVAWSNLDAAVHTVTSDEAGGPLQSPNLARGAKYTFRFETPGNYTYHCAPHASFNQTLQKWQGMVATVVVEAPGAAA